MNALHSYLNAQPQQGRHNKLYQNLLLPEIPQKPVLSSPKTSAQTRKVRKKGSQGKITSQTTLSPQQQHMHDQIKILLGGKTETHQIRPGLILPRIKPEQSQSKVIYSRVRKSRSYANSQKLSLGQILKDPHSFMQGYFGDVLARGR